jgi:hypothetical protein
VTSLQLTPVHYSASKDANGPNSPSTSHPSPHTAFLIVGLVLLVAINILFIVDIEFTLLRNKGDQNSDNEWGFGQVLALLLLIIPLRDAWAALQEIQEKIRERLKAFQEQFKELLRREGLAMSAVEELGHSMGTRADANRWIADTRFGNALQLVAFYGKIEMLQFLRTEGVQDSPGTISTSNQTYNPNYFKGDVFKQRSNLQQRGGMSPWYNSY